MPKPVNFSLHKTNLARRRAKLVCRDIGRFVTDAQRCLGKEIAGYALVIWTEKGEAVADWVNGDALGGYPVEDFAKHMLARTKNKYDTERVLFGPDDHE